MEKRSLWQMQEVLTGPTCRWVELSHIVSKDTPHWSGYPEITSKVSLQMDDDIQNVIAMEYTVVGQYGTHIDAPFHFWKDGKKLHELDSKKTMVLKLCVIDVSKKVAENADYGLTVDDILAWEAEYGTIPVGSFVAMRSDWSKREGTAFANADADGNPHYPGWSLEALKLLLEDRDVAGVGHEPPDTDPPGAGNGWAGELYILKQNKFQIEVMKNLDQVPASGALLFASWANVIDSPGFLARCIAIVEE